MVRKTTLILLFLFYSLRFTNLKAQNCSINAGIDFSACANETIKIQAYNAGSLAAIPGFTWTQIAGPSITIVSPSLNSTFLTGFSRTGNVYKFVASINCQLGGKAYDTITITIKQTPLKPNNGRDTSFCPGLNPLASSPALSANETGLWTEFNVSYYYTAITNASIPVTTINGYTYGKIGYFKWSVINNITGCVDADTNIITFCGSEKVNAGPDLNTGDCYVGPAFPSFRIGHGSFVLTNSLPSNPGSYCSQLGKWTLVSKPSSAPIPGLSSDNSNANFTVTNLYPGTYKFAWTVSGPCSNGSDTMTLTVPLPKGRTVASFNPQYLYVCGETKVALLSNITLLSKQRFIPWIKLSGSAGDSIADINSYNTIVHKLKLPTGTSSYQFYNYRYGIYDSICQNFFYGNVYIYLFKKPTVNFKTKSVTLPCATYTTTVFFEYKNINFGFYLRNLNGSNTGFNYTINYIDSITGKLTINTTTPGVSIYRLQSNSANACASEAADDISVYVSNSPSLANSGSNQRLLCNTDSTFLVANVPAIGSGLWSQVSGPNIVTFIPNKTSNVIKVKNLSQGTYILRWSINNGSCTPNYDDVTVWVAKNPPILANAGPDKTICYGSPFKSLAKRIQDNEQGIWSIKPTGPTFSNTSDSNAIVSNLSASNVYTCYWTVSNACGTLKDSSIITTLSSQGPSKANAGNDSCYPSTTTTITLTGNAPIPSSATITWSAIGAFIGTITTPGSSTTTVTSLTPGHYKFLYTFTISGCDPVTDTVLISISNKANTIFAGKDTSLCGLDSLKLYATNPKFGKGNWSQISGPTIVNFSKPSDSNSIVKPFNEGTYLLRWTGVNGVCPIVTDDINIFMAKKSSPAIASRDSIMCSNNNLNVIKLSAIRPIVGSGTWSIRSGPVFYLPYPDTSIIPNPITVFQSGTFVYVWTVRGNGVCPISTDSVVIQSVVKPPQIADQTLCNLNTTLLQSSSSNFGVWKQVGSLPNVASLTNINLWSASASNLITGQYKFYYEVGSGTCIKRDTINVTNFSLVNNFSLGLDSSYCLKDTNTLNISGPTGNVGAKKQWSMLAYPFGYSPSFLNRSDTTANVKISNLNFLGSYLIKYEVSNGGCKAESTKIIIINNGFSVAPISDINMCNGTLDTFILNTNFRIKTKPTWSKTQGNGSIPLTPNAFSTKVKVTLTNFSSSYMLKLKDSTTRCIYRDSVQIINTSSPKIGIANSKKDTFCGTNEMPIRYINILSGPSNSEIKWTRTNLINVTGIPANSGGFNAYPYIGGWVVENATSTIQEVVFTIYSKSPFPSTCIGDTIKDTVYVRPNVTLKVNLSILNNKDLCTGQPITAYWTSLPNILNYTLSEKQNGGGQVYYSGLNDTVTFVPISDQMVLTVTDSGGCVAYETVYFSFNGYSIKADFSLNKNGICWDDSTEITDNAANGSYYTFTTGYYGSGDTIYDGKNANTFFLPNKFPGISKVYMLVYDSKLGCPFVDSINIDIIPAPEFTVELIKDSVCLGDNVEFILHLKDPDNLYPKVLFTLCDYPDCIKNVFYNDYDSMIVINSNDFINSGYSPGSQLTMYFNGFDKNSGCNFNVPINFTICDIPTADAGPNVASLYFNDSVLIGGSPAGSCNYCVGNLSYSWYPTDSLTNPNSPNTFTKTDIINTYYLTVTDSISGCNSTASMQILTFLNESTIKLKSAILQNNVLLNWNALNVNLLTDYEIQKSIDGNTFEKIASINNVNQPILNYTDMNVIWNKTPLVYYKIIANYSNAKQISNVEVVTKNWNNQLKINCIPNPALKFTTVNYSGPKGLILLEILDANGKLLFTKHEQIIQNLQSILIPLNEKIPGGAYVLKCTTSNGLVNSTKLIVNVNE